MKKEQDYYHITYSNRQAHKSVLKPTLKQKGKSLLATCAQLDTRDVGVKNLTQQIKQGQ